LAADPAPHDRLVSVRPPPDLSYPALIRVLTGNDRAACAMAFSPGGMRIATGSRDGAARVWEAATGGPVCFLTSSVQAVSAVASSPDATHVATAGIDRTVRIWDELGNCTASIATDKVSEP
jgi:WD40 repeat protein